jgi:hypothetical protein
MLSRVPRLSAEEGYDTVVCPVTLDRAAGSSVATCPAALDPAAGSSTVTCPTTLDSTSPLMRALTLPRVPWLWTLSARLEGLRCRNMFRVSLWAVGLKNKERHT